MTLLEETNEVSKQKLFFKKSLKVYKKLKTWKNVFSSNVKCQRTLLTKIIHGYIHLENFMAFLNSHSYYLLELLLWFSFTIMVSFELMFIHYPMFSCQIVQVNLWQKLFFLQNMGRTCCVQKLFWVSETISVHNMFSPGLSLEFSCIELVIQWTICRHIVG